MYLVRISPYELIDLNTGIRWYNAFIGLYATLPHATGSAAPSTCIVGKAQERVWKHLESLVKYDTTATADPQPAPVETPRFKVGDEVREIDYRKNSGVIICVLPHDPEYDQRYLVSWNGDRFYFDVELAPAD